MQRWLQDGVMSPAVQPLVGQVPGASADHSTCQSLVRALNVQRCLVAFPRSHAKE